MTTSRAKKLSGIGLRGIIWIVVGVALHVIFWAIGRPLVMRGTNLPWGLVVAGLGAVILAFDIVMATRRAFGCEGAGFLWRG